MQPMWYLPLSHHHNFQELVQVDFTIANSIRTILGFDSQLIPAGGLTTQQIQQTGDSVASFNTITSLLIHSDLTSRGIRVNNKYNQAIAQITPNVTPGSLIVDAPFRPPRIPCPELVNSKRTRMRFWLTDQDDNLVDTNDEIFGCRFEIIYTM